MSSAGIVSILDSSNKSVGTGFYVSSDGNIITCRHVLESANCDRVGQIVKFKKEDNDTIFNAKLVKKCGKKEDLAIISTEEKCKDFLTFCERDASGVTVDCFGYPHKERTLYRATPLFARYTGNKIQLEDAHTITNGFSGSPLIYKETVIGIVCAITKEDSNGRLTNTAWAISSKRVLDLLFNYVSKKEICTGYGRNSNQCMNYVEYKVEKLCEKCFDMQFLDWVKLYYEAQGYKIHQCDGYFVAELEYGINTFFIAVLTIVKRQVIQYSDWEYTFLKSKKSNFPISDTFIITDTPLDNTSKLIAEKERIKVYKKIDLLYKLFNYTRYKEDLMKYARSKELSSHYIEVYGTAAFDEQLSYFSSYEYDEEFGYLELDEDDDLEESESQVKDTEPKILMKDYVSDFLVSHHNALLILGDYGSGKTSFCYTYALSLFEDFLQKKTTFMPIVIKLRDYNKILDMEQVVTNYFVNDLGNTNFTLASFRLLLKSFNVLLIFDGYDEVAKKVDFTVKYGVLKEICSLAENNTKIILTCRPNYFQSEAEFKKVFQSSALAYEPGEKPLPEFIENTIAELTLEQAKEYIASYQDELKTLGVSTSEIMEAIDYTHDLTDLAKRPFLLYMIVHTLPKILKDIKEKKEVIRGDEKSKLTINASELYKRYTAEWLNREDSKNKTLIEKSGKELFCKELAFKLYTTDSASLSAKEFPNEIQNHFDIANGEVNYYSHDIQTCSFLTSDGRDDFKFIHKSFMEYFVADRVTSKLSSWIKDKEEHSKEFDIIVQKLETILGSIYFSMEICLFINDLRSSQQQDVFQEAILYFKDVNSITKTNMMSIISKKGINMADFLHKNKVLKDDILRVDFSGSIFEGESLKDMSFENVHFYNVIFDNIVFVRCDFSGVYFDKCELKAVKFYQCNFKGAKWKNSKITDSIFNYCYLDEIEQEVLLEEEQYLEQAYENCNFEDSTWEKCIIKSCTFIGCNLIGNQMHSMSIRDSRFEYVDLSATEIMGSRDFSNNTFKEVSGRPYLF